MMRPLFVGVLAGMLVWPLLPAPAPGGPLVRWLTGQCSGPPPGYTANPMQVVASTPGPYRYPAYQTGPYPWYGYGFGVPTYNWGYFGARYRPHCVGHSGYYGDFTQWSYRRGY